MAYNIQAPKQNTLNLRGGLSAGPQAPAKFTANTKGQVMFGITPEMKNVPIFPTGSYNKAQPYAYQEVKPEKVKMSLGEKLGIAMAAVGTALGILPLVKGIGGLFKSKKSKNTQEAPKNNNKDVQEPTGKKTAATPAEVKSTPTSVKTASKFVETNPELSQHIRNLEQTIVAQNQIKTGNTKLEQANTAKIEKLNLDNTALDTTIKDLGTQIGNLKKLISESPGNEELNTKLSNLKDDKKVAEDTKEANLKTLETLTKENEELEIANKNADDIITDLAAELEELKKSEQYKTLTDPEKGQDKTKSSNGNPLPTKENGLDVEGRPTSFTREGSLFTVNNPYGSSSQVVEKTPNSSGGINPLFAKNTTFPPFNN